VERYDRQLLAKAGINPEGVGRIILQYYPKAAEDQLLTAQQQYRGGVPGEIKTKLAPRKLADVLRLKRDFVAAEQLLLSLVQRFPDDSITWHTLGRVYLDSRQRVKLLSVVERLKDCPQGELFALLLRATWHLAHQELDVAGELIDRLIGLAPQMPLPRILRTQWLTQCGAPLADRIQACRDILRLQPGHVDAQRLLQSLEATARRVALPAPQELYTSLVLGVGFPGCVEVT